MGIDKFLGDAKMCEVVNTRDKLDENMINRYPNLSMSKKPEYDYNTDSDSETGSISDVTDSLDAESISTDSEVELLEINSSCEVFPDIDDNTGSIDYDNINVDDKSSFNEVVSVAMNPFTPVGIGERRFFNSPLNCY